MNKRIQQKKWGVIDTSAFGIEFKCNPHIIFHGMLMPDSKQEAAELLYVPHICSQP